VTGPEQREGWQRERRMVPVPDGLDGLRLDAVLARLFGFSRTAAASLADAGGVSVDGVVRRRSDRVSAGALLEVALPAPATPASPAPEPVPGLTVLYADDDVVVVDKPVGVAAHPSPGWEGATVVQGIAAMGHRVSTSGAAERQGVVHRLDVGTTGLMVVAASERAYTLLKDAFRGRTVDKGYHALVQGHPDPTRGTIDAPIDRHPSQDWRFAVVAGGKPSVTHYETLEAFRAATLLDVRLETGRTHQIRVHLAAIRHPCVGDLSYGADPTLAARLGLGRQWLHACRLGFPHPADGRWVEFTSPYPDDLARALSLLREPA
jgi:23S rRNA pseudouridine1911/1915/1917 synthase